MSESIERLNLLAKAINANTYLEIGVASGITFRNVDVHYKVAVDPHFEFDSTRNTEENVFFHETTSDVFFTQIAKSHPSFDLIFLDGLHTFEQTFRDFCVSLNFSHPKTIWLIDDTCPTSLLASIPNLSRALFLRESFRIRDRRWMGDVFKVIFAIHDFFPQFSYATFPGHGQTVVWRKMRDDFHPIWNSLHQLSGMKYRDFRRYRNTLMQFKKCEDIISNIVV